MVRRLVWIDRISNEGVFLFSINELVQHKKNGFVFKTREELFGYLVYWFERFPENERLVNIKQEFHENLVEFQNFRWTPNWIIHAWPLFE